jgi:hypothetical protein
MPFVAFTPASQPLKHLRELAVTSSKLAISILVV